MNPLPFNIQIEPHRGCNLKCEFCGLFSNFSDNLKRKHASMSVADADYLSKYLNDWFDGHGKRIEITGHGEPTLNPDLSEIIGVFRKNYPQCQISLITNGIVLLKEFQKKVDDLFKSGLNVLVIDAYNGSFDKFANKINGSGWDFIDYYKSPCHLFKYGSNDIKEIVIMDDLAKKAGSRINKHMENMSGNVNMSQKYLDKFGYKKITKPLAKKCTRPFRDLYIAYDLDILLCCLDFSKSFVLGNVREDDLAGVWNSEILNTIRQLLYNNNRKFFPCNSCDFNGGCRQGLIKNPDINMTNDELLNVVYNFKHTEKYRRKNEYFNGYARGINRYSNDKMRADF